MTQQCDFRYKIHKVLLKITIFLESKRRWSWSCCIALNRRKHLQSIKAFADTLFDAESTHTDRYRLNPIMTQR